MNLEEVKKEIEQKAKDHKHPVQRRVLMAAFQGLVLHEFVDKAYCRLLGRMPDGEEKEEIYRNLYSGQVNQYDWLESVLESEECKARGIDFSEFQTELDQYRKQCKKPSFGNRLKKWIKMSVNIWKGGV